MKSGPPSSSKIEVDRRVFYGALALSCASAALSGYAVLDRRGTAPAGARDDAALRAEIAELRRSVEGKLDGARGSADLQRLSTRVANLERRGNGAAGGDGDGAPAAAGADPVAAASARASAGGLSGMKFVKLEASVKAITVKQMEDGSLSVVNTDPSLTGSMSIIKARAEDGSEHDIPVTIPAP